MSYDLRIAVKVDGAEKGNEYAVIAEPRLSNPTYNIGEMSSGNPIWDVAEIGEAFDMAIEALSSEPKQKIGTWEQESESLRKDRRSRWKCSACGKHVLIGVYDDPIEAGLMFCPSCGAKMEET